MSYYLVEDKHKFIMNVFKKDNKRLSINICFGLFLLLILPTSICSGNNQHLIVIRILLCANLYIKIK